MKTLVASYRYITNRFSYYSKIIDTSCTILDLIYQRHKDILAHSVWPCLFNRMLKQRSLQHIKKPISCKQLYFVAHCYCTCSYTTHVVWQTKCELMMCIYRVSLAFAIPRAHAKIACNSACTQQFWSYALVKHASTHMYLHACVKFKLSCTVQ